MSLTKHATPTYLLCQSRSFGPHKNTWTTVVLSVWKKLNLRNWKFFIAQIFNRNISLRHNFWITKQLPTPKINMTSQPSETGAFLNSNSTKMNWKVQLGIKDSRFSFLYYLFIRKVFLTIDIWFLCFLKPSFLK